MEMFLYGTSIKWSLTYRTFLLNSLKDSAEMERKRRRQKLNHTLGKNVGNSLVLILGPANHTRKHNKA